MTDWITPKTNWSNGDFYNVEDNNRIKNNLQVLIEIASDIFETKTVTYLVKNYYDDYYDLDVYAQYDMSPKNMTVTTDPNLTMEDLENLDKLCRLSLLCQHYADEGTPDYYDGVTDLICTSIGGYGPVYYVGYGYVKSTEEEISTLWRESWLFLVRCPFNWAMMEGNYIIAGTEPPLLENQSFRSALELNQIEAVMQVIYLSWTTEG